MYLSRIELSMNNAYVRQGLQNRQKLHQLITEIFGSSRKDGQILYRYKSEGMKVILYTYSSIPISENKQKNGLKVTGSREVTDWLKTMRNGQIMSFDLVTMPFKKISDGNRKNSQRRALRQSDERIEWLNRKATQNGFSILYVREDPGEKIFGKHNAERGGDLHLNSWRYTGTLQIRDENLFREAVKNGIGADKAYGLGMLLLANGREA